MNRRIFVFHLYISFITQKNVRVREINDSKTSVGVRISRSRIISVSSLTASSCGCFPLKMSASKFYAGGVQQQMTDFAVDNERVEDANSR